MHSQLQQDRWAQLPGSQTGDVWPGIRGVNLSRNPMCLPRQHAELPTQTPLWDGASRSTQTGGGASHCSGVSTYTRGRNRRRIRVAHCCSRGAWRPGDRPELWNKFRAKIMPRPGLVVPQPTGPPRCSHMWPAGLGPVQRRLWQVWSSVRLTSVSPPVQRDHMLVDL